MDPNIPLEQILQKPAAAPPGVTPNLVGPPNQGPAARGITLTFWILCTVTLSLRLYTKFVLIRKVDLSDYSIKMAWVVFLGDFTSSWLFFQVAPGVDQWNLQLKDYSSLMLYFQVGGVLYGCCIFFIKLAILLQLIDIFVPVRRTGTFYWTCQILILVNFIFYFICCFLGIFFCKPIARFHKPWIEGTCINASLVNVVASCLNAASDIFILILPQLRIWSLQMPLSRRIAVSAVFLVGIMACSAGVVRLAFSVVLMKSKNHTYYAYQAGIWTLPELSMGIVVACLPVLPRFVKRLDASVCLSRIRSSLYGVLSGIGSRSRSHGYSPDYTGPNNGSYTTIHPGKNTWPDSLPLVSTLSMGASQPSVANGTV